MLYCIKSCVQISRIEYFKTQMMNTYMRIISYSYKENDDNMFSSVVLMSIEKIESIFN